MKYVQIFNLCYLINQKGEVLLQKKARGFGKGNWNGPGGKREKGETNEESMLREIKEETGASLKNWKKRGELKFIFPHDNYNFFTYVYISYDWEGEPVNKGEGELKWFSQDKIPLDKMWDDDKYWLLDLLKGKLIKMEFYFDQNNKVVEHKRLN
jgi:8-oxo-dGTP diphosphatase